MLVRIRDHLIRTSTTSGNSSQNTLSLRLKTRLWADSCLFCKNKIFEIFETSQVVFNIVLYLRSPVDTHCVVRGLNTAEGGAFLHHEAEQTCEDGGDGPRWVPRVWMEVCDGQT